MDLLWLVLMAAFAGAFLVSLVDYFVDLGIYRALIAMGASAVAMLPAAFPNIGLGVLLACSASFVAMFMLAVVERLNYRAGRVR